MRPRFLRVSVILALVAACAPTFLFGFDTSVADGFSCVKKDRSGRTWAVRKRHENARDILTLGPLAPNGTIEEQAAFVSDAEIFSPDLDFDGESRPWLVWIEVAGGIYRVRAVGLGMGESLIVNGPLTASALNPLVRAGANGEVWVIWTGRDSGRDEIFGALYRNSAWSSPFKLDADGRFPHLEPASAVDGAGHPRVVWAAYEGVSYDVVSVAWDGSRWGSEEKITDNPAADLVPAIAFLRGMIPVLVWNRIASGRSSLLARVKIDSVWSPEVTLVDDTAGPVRRLDLEAAGDRFVVTWDSGGETTSRTFTLSECRAGAEIPNRPQAMALTNQVGRDENQYVGFGDSITYANGDGYVPKLETLLAQRYGSAKVWNAGEGGETTAAGLARIDDVTAATSSGYLLLLEGTNDIIDLHISADTTAFNLQEMANRCQRAGMAALLATILPRNDTYGNDPFFKNKIDDLNAKISLIPAALGISLVDMSTAFYSYPNSAGGWTSLLLADGVHPNDTGFTLMAQTWFDALKDLKKPQPPLSPALNTRLDTTASRKINAVSWQANPQNAAGTLANYRVYRKRTDQADTAFALLVTVSASVLSVEDTNLDIPTKYAYRMTAVSLFGDESAPSSTVTETREFVFPPLNLNLESNLTASETKKVNVLTWQVNSNNAATPLKNYVLYRKLASQGDAAFALLATVPSSSLGYEDTNLDIPTKYAYRITAVSHLGDESVPSSTVTETRELVVPPLNLSLESSLTASETKKVNVLTWQVNPNNAATPLKNYVLYRKLASQGDGAFVLLATVPSSFLGYEDTSLDIPTKYSYRITALSHLGDESVPSSTVTETREFVFPPLNLSLESSLTASETKKVNILTWQANPNNAATPLRSYVLYRKLAGQEDGAFALLATAASTSLSYEDANLDIKTKYAYRATSVAQSGIESSPTPSVVETTSFIFPPLNVAVQTALNKILFYEEKYNTVSFASNDLNDEAGVSGFAIYRRKAEDGDDAFVRIATLDAPTLGYRDGRLPSKQRYAYTVTTLFLDGRESRRPAAVTDK